ncbi:DUF2157 domain-containing protein [Nocardia crassostreae]|uniref:DUF2157 domain-containing protein n=1 Tax=Nocardia crassostreae TaxID=53428 RepID=UPI00082FF279|nr:DUF2157 domain-containing protein [Nocardia crassostreae]
MTVDHSVGAVLGRLVDQGVLSGAQRDAVLAALDQERAARRSGGRVVAEIAAYIGAGLVLGGLLMLMDSSWDDLGQLSRVLVLVVIAIGTAGAGVWLAGPKQLFRRGGGARSVPTRSAAALFVVATIAVTALVGYALDAGGGDDEAWVAAAVAGALCALAGYAALPSLIGLLALGFFGAAAVGGVLMDWADLDDLWGAAGFLALAGIWFAVTRSGRAAPAWAGYGIAILTGIFGGILAEDSHVGWAVACTLLVAVTCFAVYSADRNPVLVIGGGICVTIAVLQVIWEWFDQAVGLAAIVLLIGATVLGVAGFRLTRDRA